MAISLASGPLGGAFDWFAPSRALQYGPTQEMVHAFFFPLHPLFSYRTPRMGSSISGGLVLQVPSNIPAHRALSFDLQATRSVSYALIQQEVLPGAFGLFHLTLSFFVQ